MQSLDATWQWGRRGASGAAGAAAARCRHLRDPECHVSVSVPRGGRNGVPQATSCDCFGPRRPCTATV